MNRPATPMTDNPAAPYSQEAEEAVLGCILVDRSAFITVASFLREDDFFLVRHRYIWQSFARLAERGDPIDTLTTAEELENLGVLQEIGGRTYLTRLINNTPTAIYAEVYGQIVHRAAVRRRMLAASDQIRALALDEEKRIEEVITEAEMTILSVDEGRQRREFTPMWEAVSAYYDHMEHMLLHQRETPGVPTGFRDLDQLLGGFQKSDLLVFAGRPGMGKCLTGDAQVMTAAGLAPLAGLRPNGVGVLDGEGGMYFPLVLPVMSPQRRFVLTSHFYDGGVKPVLRITTQRGYNLTGTHAHPVCTQDAQGRGQWTPLARLRPGDRVRIHPPEAGAAPAWDTLQSITAAGYQRVYDLVVPEGHAFIANGIVCHNTSFLLTVAMNAARFGARIAIFTMEMGTEQLVQRMVSMESGINVQKLRLAKLTPQEQSRFVEVVGRIGEFPIFIDDTPALSPMEIRTKCRRLLHEHGLDMVMIDYMQLMNAGKGYENNRVQEISYISRSLKELAREFNVPVISAAQLSRAVEQRNDKRPVLSDLRESGSIEQDSDIVMFLYRDEVYNEATEFPNQAEVIIAKHRNGPTGTISLYFEKQLTKFMDASVHRVDLSDLG